VCTKDVSPRGEAIAGRNVLRAAQLSARAGSPAAGHDVVGNPGAPDSQLRRTVFFIRDLALLRSSRHHVQKKSAHAEEQQRPGVLKQRQDWFVAQLDLDSRKLVFIDETEASTNLARKLGRCRCSMTTLS
jgi:hypothetical protein